MIQTPRQLLNPRCKYHTIFSDVCKTRFNHLVTRLFFICSIFQTVGISLLALPYLPLWELALAFIPNVLVLNLVSLLIIVTRKNYMHVKNLGFANSLTFVLGQLLSLKFLVYQGVYFIGSFLLSFVLSAVFGRGSGSKPYYRLFIWVIVPTIYNVQHHVTDADKLSFNCENFFQAPQDYVLERLKKIFEKSIILSVASMFILPFFTIVILSSQTPGLFVSFTSGVASIINLLMISCIIFITFEFINIAFDAHMSIGCLHKGKLISNLSATPMETLLSGLSSDKAFTKLTAHQELAYRATSLDPSLRAPIYHSKFRSSNGNTWSLILKECLKTIQANNETVVQYLRSIQDLGSSATTRHQRKVDNLDYMYENGKLINTNERLFGNRPSMMTPSRDNDLLDGSPNKFRVRTDDSVLLNRGNKKRSSSSYLQNDLDETRQTFNGSIFTHETTFMTAMRLIFKKLKNSIMSFIFPSYAERQLYDEDDNYEILPSSSNKAQISIIDIWSISKKRQAEKLIPLPICHANSLVALTGLLIKSRAEDPKGGIIASVGDILKILERSICALGEFADWDPESMAYTAFHAQRTAQDRVQHDSEDEGTVNDTTDMISVLYQLSTSAFMEIVLEYNIALNDVYLDADVAKLANWFLEVYTTSASAAI
ncbi:Ndc1p SKDI_13G1050 [Saccharomyces kudriavzevii IFO 1802]|uniref:NDC1-like protein n=1 Tax=Saccharomyces kudriavzevii (strain ATCC MYA-4449 / AS 2.2408 / CBS 8840 / NBRC 1802 / NCYC 2889) TaxID=226230 RepID=A0AA35J5G3_SACK1|nr:uncharacterized protein SKDI_13G1050 [Saccharomyces kudriavzevii IFO 1802]CAI4047779.1 hypothetical protein SKDI_13G1050 [Saccharomyces kudriavzevii IFO 1802]